MEELFLPAKDVRKEEINTAEPLVPVDSTFNSWEKYEGGLKSQCKNENYLIFWDKPFLFFNIVSF
jgi:hypothetical protein